MLRIAALISALLGAGLATGAQAETVARYLPSGGLRGQADFRFLGVKIYGAELFTPKAAAYQPQAPVALRLTYHRQISASQFLRSTMSELDRIEGSRSDHADLRLALAPCFRDVSAQDSYVAFGAGPNDLRLARNGQETCRVQRPGISPRFFGIWLSDQSRSPRLTRQLRGE